MALSATMPKARGHGIEGVQALKDQIIGPSGWREVTQEMINQFAELSGDDQWIHVDVERAAAESPFGTTVAHGNLTLSLNVDVDPLVVAAQLGELVDHLLGD